MRHLLPLLLFALLPAVVAAPGAPGVPGFASGLVSVPCGRGTASRFPRPVRGADAPLVTGAPPGRSLTGSAIGSAFIGTTRGGGGGIVSAGSDGLGLPDADAHAPASVASPVNAAAISRFLIGPLPVYACGNVSLKRVPLPGVLLERDDAYPSDAELSAELAAIRQVAGYGPHATR